MARLWRPAQAKARPGARRGVQSAKGLIAKRGRASRASAMPARKGESQGKTGSKSSVAGVMVDNPSQRRNGASKTAEAMKFGASRTRIATLIVTSQGNLRKARPITLATAIECRMPKKMNSRGIISQVASVTVTAAPARIARRRR